MLRQDGLDISRLPTRSVRSRVSDHAKPMEARNTAFGRIAFHMINGVGTRDITTIAAQWLARTYPCQRFAACLATYGA